MNTPAVDSAADLNIPKITPPKEVVKELPTPSNAVLPEKTMKPKKVTRLGKILLTIALTLLVVLGGFAGVSAYFGLQLEEPVMATKTHALAAVDALKAQNLDVAKAELDAAAGSLQTLKQKYGNLGFWLYSPLHWHYQDGQHVLNSAEAGIEAGRTVVKAVEPYADVLGFKGGDASLSGTTEDRVAKLIETLDLIKPQIQVLEEKLRYIDSEVSYIDPRRYPIISIQGKPVQDIIGTAKSTIHQADTLVSQYKPVIDQFPKIAGVDTPKTYLVLFQNDGELRPTGGFMTAYAIIRVDKGKAIPDKSDDIYELDKKFKQRLPAPEPIKKYLKNVPYWYLRDMNLSPDFKVSMDTFAPYYQEVPGEPKVDGIIAVNTKLLVHLLEVLGPVDVPGYGVFTNKPDARCDCPQIVYALENIITRPTPNTRNDRKGVLGPLMQTILRKAYDAPKEVNPKLFQAVLADVQQKNIMLYYFNPELQQTAEAISAAGRIKEYAGDYLHINDANFGGAKSNIFVVQEVEDIITKEGNGVKHELTIIYKNPAKASNCNLEAGQLCLNGVLNDWMRIYLPKGAQLGEALGFEDDTTKTSEDLGKTVIEGLFKLTPQSQAKLRITYTVPYQPAGEYQYLIQKQPGTDNPKYTVTYGATRKEFNLTTDTELKFPQ